MNVPFLGAGSLSRGQSVKILNDDVEHSKQIAVESIERGVNHQSRMHDQPQQPTGRVTSNYFPPNKMRINESTTETYDRIASKIPDGSRSNRNLREYRAAESHVLEIKGDPIEGSEDELAQPNSPKSRRKQPPPKTMPQGKTASKRKVTAGQYYQLNYVRTLDSVHDRTQLTLRQTDNPKIFRITGADLDGNVKTLHQLNLNSVNKVTADNTHRMRLTGPLDTQGGMHWYDLEFEDAFEFAQFRNNYVFPECNASHQIIKGS